MNRRVLRGLGALLYFAPLFLLAPRALSQASMPHGASRPLVVHLKIRDEIQPLLAEYIDRGLASAADSHAALVLISMDTPGGLSDSMQDIVQHILQSPVPVAVYVAPTGSRGASAGFFVLLSADVAAMAPGTHTGAASPVMEFGGYPVTIDETLRRKILNDASAFLRSYDIKRGRNDELAQTAVIDAKAFTETEALSGKLIELIANSEDDLLRQLDGRPVKRFDGSTTVLHLTNPERTDFDLTAREKFLARIVQPDIFFVLLLAGALGLYTEFTHPGMILPGVIGGICLILVLYAAHLLPVNVSGVLLILLALGMFIAEAKFTSHGVLAIGGIISMLLGALMLVRSPLTSAGVSLSVALGATLPFAFITIFLMRLVLKSRSWKQTTGVEQLVGAVGEVTQSFDGTGGVTTGMVRVHGELWQAHSSSAMAAGSRVRVLGVHGLTLEVEPAP